MLNESIATIYKKAGDDNYNKINTDEKKTQMGDKDILNGMLTNDKNESFTTL